MGNDMRVVDLFYANPTTTVLLVPSEDGQTLLPIVPEGRTGSMDATGLNIHVPTVQAADISYFKRHTTVQAVRRMGFTHAQAVDWRTWLTAVGVRNAACWALNYGDFQDEDAETKAARLKEHVDEAAEKAARSTLWCVTVSPSDLDRRCHNIGNASGYMLAENETDIPEAARYGGNLFSDFVTYGQFDPRNGEVQMEQMEG